MNDDTISRQWLMECVEEGWIKFDTQDDENRFVHLIRDIAPSAQPNLQPTCNQLATDTISRAAAIETVRKAKSIGQAHRMLVQLPSAQPDIIACGDCKHWICHDRRCGFWNHSVKPLDWCCHAERRSDG